MRKEIITYVDYNGVSRTEEFYFNLTQAEVTEMDLSAEGGYQAMMRRIISSKNGASIIKEFKNFLLKSYGEKSADGKRFIKSEAISEAFTQTPAYDKLFMELILDGKKMGEFCSEVLPPVDPKAMDEARAAMKNDPLIAANLPAEDNVVPIQ